MSFGNTLRAAREAKGFTTSELASRTHILVQAIEGLENEDFRRIPAPIYGRGFVKLYCEAVGLDPKPLQAEFMDLYTREKSGKRTDPEPPPRMPPPQAKPQQVEPQQVKSEPAVERPSATDSGLGELFDQPIADDKVSDDAPPVSDLAKNETPAAEPSSRKSYEDLFSHSYSGAAPQGVSAAEKFRNTMSNVSKGVFANVKKLPPNTARIALVAAAGIVALILAAWGISELYRATSTQDGQGKTQQAGPAAPAGVSKPDRPASKRAGSGSDAKRQSGRKALKASGIDVPQLYID